MEYKLSEQGAMAFIQAQSDIRRLWEFFENLQSRIECLEAEVKQLRENPVTSLFSAGYQVGDQAKAVKGIAFSLNAACMRISLGPEYEEAAKGIRDEIREIRDQAQELNGVVMQLRAAEAVIKEYVNRQLSKPNTTNKGENTNGKNH